MDFRSTLLIYFIPDPVGEWILFELFLINLYQYDARYNQNRHILIFFINYKNFDVVDRRFFCKGDYKADGCIFCIGVVDNVFEQRGTSRKSGRTDPLFGRIVKDEYAFI
jgi:hypothetical protein